MLVARLSINDDASSVAFQMFIMKLVPIDSLCHTGALFARPVPLWVISMLPFS
jgi:hypothetical protein